MKYIHALASLSILFGCSQIHAQDSNIVTKEILTVCVNGQMDGLYYRSGNDVYRLRAFQTGIGAPILYKGTNPLYLYAKPSDLLPPKKGEIVPKPVAKVTFPSDKRVLLIFKKGMKNKSKISVSAFGASTDSLQAGDYRIYNFSQQNIYTMMGKKKVKILPRKHTVLSSSQWRQGIMDLEVRFGIESKKSVKKVYSSVWGHRPQKRHFLFVFDRPNSPNRPLDIRRYYDVPSVPVSPAAAEKCQLSDVVSSNKSN